MNEVFFLWLNGLFCLGNGFGIIDGFFSLCFVCLLFFLIFVVNKVELIVFGWGFVCGIEYFCSSFVFRLFGWG